MRRVKQKSILSAVNTNVTDRDLGSDCRMPLYVAAPHFIAFAYLALN